MLMSFDWLSKENVVAQAQKLIGQTMSQAYPQLNEEGCKNKGHLGQLIEEHHFGLKVNSEARPDFEKLGVELKTSGLRRKSNGILVAKERISLGMIDYFQIVHEQFWTSGFWKKNEHLLIIFYIHSAKPFIHRKIQLANLWVYSKNDLIIIEQDWKFIRDKVNNGRAHELSEGDTMYLGASTKGANKTSLRAQPNSEIQAMSRAYSLKTTYVNHIVQTWTERQRKERAILDESDVAKLERVGFDEVVLDRFRPFYGMDVRELADAVGFQNLNLESKSVLAELSRAIMGVLGKSKIPEFEAAGITMKTIRLKEYGMPQESMSFPAFDFTELVNENWEESDLRNLLDSSRFFFVVFEKYGDGSLMRLKKAKFWTMPQSDIEKSREAWDKTREILTIGTIIQAISPKGKRRTNFPGAKDFPIVHVRPHAKDSSDVRPLPKPDELTRLREYTKQSFWLSNHYVKQIIS